MASWLKKHPPTRTSPRLWIETVWLLKSREPLDITRTVDLHPGVNVVWAQEPDSEEASSLDSAGHGVGKTSFCLLLRYCLNDVAPSIAALRDKAAATFPKGGVAARVHVDGVSWVIFRPYGGFSHSMAGIGNTLEALLAGELAGDFQGYVAALYAAFIGKLTATTLPGSNQPIEWRHLLAWCIRDQKTRFDGFFHWRDGDGLGFRRSRQDPPLFVRSVLGLLDAESDRLLRAVEATQSDLNDQVDKLPELEREPIYALAQAERLVRTQLRADEDVPVLEALLGTSLESMVREGLEAAQRAEAKWDIERAAAESAVGVELLRQAELQREITRLEADEAVAKALAEANETRYNELITEPQRLERLAGFCKDGHVDFAKCSHIQARKTTISLPWRMDQKTAMTEIPKLQEKYALAVGLTASAKAELKIQGQTVSTKQAAVRRLLMRSSTSEINRDELKKLWADLMLRREQRKQKTDTSALENSKEKIKKLTLELNSQRSAWAKRNLERSDRAEALKALTRCVAGRLLGVEGYGRFMPESDSRPFDLAVGGEAYQVLEVLLGDIVCLVDSATSSSSNHPGFLVHDCPREADMSERLYREYLLMTVEAQEQLSALALVPFQYIVTTTSPPPEELRNPANLALVLHPGAEEHLLFKRKLMTSLPGMDIVEGT